MRCERGVETSDACVCILHHSRSTRTHQAPPPSCAICHKPSARRPRHLKGVEAWPPHPHVSLGLDDEHGGERLDLGRLTGVDVDQRDPGGRVDARLDAKEGEREVQGGARGQGGQAVGA